MNVKHLVFEAVFIFVAMSTVYGKSFPPDGRVHDPASTDNVRQSEGRLTDESFPPDGRVHDPASTDNVRQSEGRLTDESFPPDGRVHDPAKMDNVRQG